MKREEQIRLRQYSRHLAALLRRYRAVLLVLLAGVLLLLSGGILRDRSEENTQLEKLTPMSGVFDLTQFENSLTQRLSEIDGVGTVSLMLSLDASGESVYAADVRQSQSGGESESYESSVTVISGSGYREEPVTVKQMLPVFRGAVVLCDGADTPAVRLAVTDAVGAVCGLGADRISVLKRAADA